jgi:hypothetical protein
VKKTFIKLAPVAVILPSILAISIPAFAAASTKRPSAAKMLGIAIQSGSKMNSVHYESYDHLGQVTISENGYVGRSKGYILSDYKDGKSTGSSEEIFLSGKLFLKANSYTLVNFFGFKKKGAGKYGNKWISIPKSDVTYVNLTASLTIAGQMQQIKIPGKITYLKNSRLNGRAVTGIVGHPTSVGGLKETETLYINPSGNHLPIKATLSQGKNAEAYVSFIKWNPFVDVNLPKNSTPISKTGLE